MSRHHCSGALYSYNLIGAYRCIMYGNITYYSVVEKKGRNEENKYDTQTWKGHILRGESPLPMRLRIVCMHIHYMTKTIGLASKYSRHLLSKHNFIELYQRFYLQLSLGRFTYIAIGVNSLSCWVKGVCNQLLSLLATASSVVVRMRVE